ncbi:MAG: alpha-amylase, partial [Planctomycetes bacterium]|nr:alpha-amylase [Planctomycetota bacterium]
MGDAGEVGTIQFSLVIHNHQPVGNFDHVLERAHLAAYGPLLDALERYPAVPVALHVSGPLLRWMERARPADVDRIAALAERGQLEVIGGGFYEPIFPLIPSRDRVGQIVSFADHLEARLGRRPRGLWLPERVWESA